jgi:flagellar biosynthetic protein FliR
MDTDPLFTYATLFGFLFTLARISGVFAFLPLAAFRAGPETARIVLALGCTILLWESWKTPAAGMDGDIGMGRLVAGIASEAALGLAIGLALAIALEVFQFAAQAVSLAAGLGYASTIDPTSGADSTVLLTTAQITAGLLFFVSGADRLMVKALAESLRLMPPESFTLNKNWGLAMIRFSGSIFGTGLRLAAPVVALLLLADASLAVLGRVQTQLHLVSLTMPLKLAATMLLMAATLMLHPGFFEARMNEWARLMEGILRSGH